MNLAEDYRAGQEMIVGRYYLKDGNYLSALNRFNVVLEDYQTTVQIEEALYRQVEIYAIWGMNKYADGYYKILRDNYPDGKWTAKAAKIMERIGRDDPVPHAKSAPAKEIKAEVAEVEVIEEPAAEEKKSSWFSGWFGGSDEKAAEPIEEVKAEVAEVEVVEEPVAEEKKSSWFSGWFGGSDEKAAEPVEEVKAEVAEVEVVEEPVAEEKKTSWFSGWFGGDKKVEDVMADVEVAPAVEEEKKTSWFSGWFSDSEETSQKEEVREESSDNKSTFLGRWFGVGNAEAAEPEE